MKSKESVAISVHDEVRESKKKFEAEFEFTKMDTMIHRFPPGLREIRSRYPYMVVPRFVAIGPYHHGEKHLEKMEVKKAAAYYLCRRIGVVADTAREAVLKVEDKARGKYCIADVETTGVEGEGTTKAYFADMMFRDACFLLLYMDFYTRSDGKNEDDNVNKPMPRFLFSNRDSIDNDIMLLENQLPWLVIQALINLARQKGRDLHETVGKFIAAIGNSFKIRKSCEELKPYEWDDENNPPAHLLALLRRYKTENTVESVGNSNHHLPAPAPSTVQDPLLPSSSTAPPPSASSTTQEEKTQEVTWISSMSPANLEEIGIKLAASKTEAFSDMGMEEKWIWCHHLTLAPLSLSNARASCLVNMAAFEVCTASSFEDNPDRTAVCSYLAFLAFFMVGREDVHKLQSKGLLHGPHSDDDMLAFFKTVVQHLPDGGKHFSRLMEKIEKYKQNRRIRTTLYKVIYNNWKMIGTVVSIIVGLISFYRALRSLVQKN